MLLIMDGCFLQIFRLSSILLALVCICDTWAAVPPLPGQFSGIPGVDKAYDYVVSLRNICRPGLPETLADMR